MQRTHQYAQAMRTRKAENRASCGQRVLPELGQKSTPDLVNSDEKISQGAIGLTDRGADTAAAPAFPTMACRSR